MPQAVARDTTTAPEGGNVVRLTPRPTVILMPAKSPELAILTAILDRMPRKSRIEVLNVLEAQAEQRPDDTVRAAANYVTSLCFRR